MIETIGSLDTVDGLAVIGVALAVVVVGCLIALGTLAGRARSRNK